MEKNERLKILRKDSLNMTLEEFGEKLGVSRGAICAIENGKRSLTEQMIKSISNAFNVREEWLRTGEGPMYKQKPKTAYELLAEENGLPSDFAKLFQELDELQPEVREKAIHACKCLCLAYLETLEQDDDKAEE